jgi:hypothetical protein
MEEAVAEEELGQGYGEADFEEARSLQALTGQPPGSLEQAEVPPQQHLAAAAVNPAGTTGAGRGLMGGVLDAVEAAGFAAAGGAAGGGGGSSSGAGEVRRHPPGLPGLEAGARFAAELLPAEALGAAGKEQVQPVQQLPAEQQQDVDMFEEQEGEGEGEQEGAPTATAAAAGAGAAYAPLPQLSQQQSSEYPGPGGAPAPQGPFAAEAALPVDVDVTAGPLELVEAAVGHLAAQQQQQGAAGALPPEAAASAAAAAAAGLGASRSGSSAAQGAWSVGVALLRGSAFSRALCEPGAWGELAGCDVAALVEVVEHLEPGPLALLGPSLLGGRPASAWAPACMPCCCWQAHAGCFGAPGLLLAEPARSPSPRVATGLDRPAARPSGCTCTFLTCTCTPLPPPAGGLRPKVLLVTTPNWECNVVLRHAAGAAAWPGPPGRDGMPLRNSDHRFEWTRAEFAEWCGALAAQHGYGVRWGGGRAPRCGWAGVQCRIIAAHLPSWPAEPLATSPPAGCSPLATPSPRAACWPTRPLPPTGAWAAPTRRPSSPAAETRARRCRPPPRPSRSRAGCPLAWRRPGGPGGARVPRGRVPPAAGRCVPASPACSVAGPRPPSPLQGGGAGGAGAAGARACAGHQARAVAGRRFVRGLRAAQQGDCAAGRGRGGGAVGECAGRGACVGGSVGVWGC